MTTRPKNSPTETDPRSESERSEAMNRFPQPDEGRRPAAEACPCCGNPQARQTQGPADPSRRESGETPCPFCRALMRKGILLIEVEDWGGGPPGEPRRTGRVACVDESGIRRCVRPLELAEQTLRQRHAFVSQAAWESFGLAKAGAGELN